MDDKDIDFIARYYSDDAFSTDSGWRKIKSALGLRRRRYGIAAAVAAVIAVSSTAAIIGYEHSRMESSSVESVSVDSGVPTVEEAKVISFDNTRLSEAVKIIEAEYSVKIGNIPANADDYSLTLRYDGTPSELIEAINEILGLQLTITDR